MLEAIFLLGRIILGGYFLMNAMNHFTKTEMLTGYAVSKGVKPAKLAVLVSGLLLLIGGLGVLLGVYIQWAVLALTLFFLPVSFMMHAFWKVQDPMARMSEMVNFTKNMALWAAILMLLQIPKPWPFSLNP